MIAIGVENEYGSFSDDCNFMKQVGELLVELGVDVPLFTATADEPFKYKIVDGIGYWNGVDCHYLDETKHCYLQEQQGECC